jgi:hypothetical protein
MTHVWLLWHIHDLGDEEDWKFIGVYTSPDELEAAKARVGALPGFVDNPDSWRVEKVPLNEDLWTEGFETTD